MVCHIQTYRCALRNKTDGHHMSVQMYISTQMYHIQACTCVLYNKTDGHHMSTYAYTCTSHTYRWPRVG